eukprot:1832114-Rhodomonas_salina.1
MLPRKPGYPGTRVRLGFPGCIGYLPGTRVPRVLVEFRKVGTSVSRGELAPICSVQIHTSRYKCTHISKISDSRKSVAKYLKRGSTPKVGAAYPGMASYPGTR